MHAGVAQGWPTPALGVLGAVAALCIAALSRQEQQPVGTARSGAPATFQCPGFPLVPCLGAWVNLYLIAGLPPAAFARLVVWSAAGAAVYGGYSVWNSRLGVSKAL